MKYGAVIVTTWHDTLYLIMVGCYISELSYTHINLLFSARTVLLDHSVSDLFYFQGSDDGRRQGVDL